jgi:hypothetical protein
MARIGHARRKTIFSALFAATITALLSEAVLDHGEAPFEIKRK